MVLSSVIRTKSQTQYLTYVCVSRGKKCSFFGIFACFVFLKHLFWDSLFCLISDVITIIIEYVWMCLYQQDSEYNLGRKCAKILNMRKYWMAGFLICERYAGFQIYHNMTEYVLIVHEYTWICLNLR